MKSRIVLVTIVIISMAGLAGCGAEQEPRPLSEQVNMQTKVDAELRSGSSVGARFHDEQWKVTITKISEAHVNLSIEKVLLDESGQNKESTDARITFNRSFVQEGEVAIIEDDLRVWVIEINEETAWIGITDNEVEKCHETEYCTDGTTTVTRG